MREATLRRSKQRTNDLIESWDVCLEHFAAKDPFSGPSLYFHRKTLDRLPQDLPVSALDDELFFDYLYAALASWGLHRMGDTNTKLAPLGKIKDSFQRTRGSIEQIQSYTITEIGQTDVLQLAEQIAAILADLQVSESETKLVAGSKALHHLLPRLVPPVDREYTLRFFFGNKTNASLDRFPHLYVAYWYVAQQRKDQILRRLAEERMWDTSETKIIDNAIVGFVKLKL